MEKLKCLRCMHEWTPKVANPSVCPRCKSGYWNKPRRVKEPLHPDEKPQEIIEQYEEENPGTIPELVEPIDKDIVILKCLDSIMKTLERMERPPVITAGQPRVVTELYPNTPIPYTKEQASESLICARNHQFICNGEGKELCPICKQQNFWKNAQNLRIALEMESLDKAGENVPEETFETKALNCDVRTTNAGKPFCPYKYKGEAHNNYCTLCWELIPIWGDQAAGYKEQMAAKGRNR